MKVCGGNAGQLQLAASAYRGEWDAGALHELVPPNTVRYAGKSLRAEHPCSDMVVALQL